MNQDSLFSPLNGTSGTPVSVFPSKEIVIGGHLFKLHGIDADDGYFAILTENFETEFSALCHRFIQPDAVCIDVGANIGVKSLFLSRHCSVGQVIAIEPAPTVVQCLEVNIRANDARNVYVERSAIGDVTGSGFFTEASAWGHLSKGGVEVSVTTLQEIVQRLGLTRVDFIKIDAEGAEPSILKSSLDLINRLECLVLVEANAFTQLAYSDSNPREFIDWILANFSHVFAVNRRGSGDLLKAFSKVDALALLHRNMVDDHCVTDLLITNHAWRLVPPATYFEEQLRASAARYDNLYTELCAVRTDLEEANLQLNMAKSELDATIAGLNAARVKCDLLRGSASWRLTAPFRLIWDRLH